MSSQPSPAASGAVASMNSEIDRLLGEQRTVRNERKRVAAELKNAQRRRKRLKHCARLLSSDDLVKVLALRDEDQKQKAEQETRTRGKQAALTDNQDTVT